MVIVSLLAYFLIKILNLAPPCHNTGREIIEHVAVGRILRIQHVEQPKVGVFAVILTIVGTIIGGGVV